VFFVPFAILIVGYDLIATDRVTLAQGLIEVFSLFAITSEVTNSTIATNPGLDAFTSTDFRTGVRVAPAIFTVALRKDTFAATFLVSVVLGTVASARFEIGLSNSLALVLQIFLVSQAALVTVCSSKVRTTFTEASRLSPYALVEHSSVSTVSVRDSALIAKWSREELITEALAITIRVGSRSTSGVLTFVNVGIPAFLAVFSLPPLLTYAFGAVVIGLEVLSTSETTHGTVRFLSVVITAGASTAVIVVASVVVAVGFADPTALAVIRRGPLVFTIALITIGSISHSSTVIAEVRVDTGVALRTIRTFKGIGTFALITIFIALFDGTSVLTFK